MREENQDGCDHDKVEHSTGGSRTVSWAHAKSIVGLEQTQSSNTTIKVCDKVQTCEFAREQALGRFESLTNMLQDGGPIESTPYRNLEKRIAEFSLQCEKLPSKLNQVDLDKDTVQNLWEDARDLEEAVQEFEEQELEEENDIKTWLRGRPFIDNVPKTAQRFEAVEELTHRVRSRAEQKLQQEHGVTPAELKEQTTEGERTDRDHRQDSGSESQTEDETQEQSHRQGRR